MKVKNISVLLLNVSNWSFRVVSSRSYLKDENRNIQIMIHQLICGRTSGGHVACSAFQTQTFFSLCLFFLNIMIIFFIIFMNHGYNLLTSHPQNNVSFNVPPSPQNV